MKFEGVTAVETRSPAVITDFIPVGLFIVRLM